jgi:pimeloyl-ACP methyl ester carboxylesterase
MTDYVLIHGAWHGSWCWTRVRRLLAAGSQRVFTPTLTGVGERSHLLSRDVDLGTHVADVANLLIWEDLRDIVLVGHSYGGVVVRHVADRMPDRIRSLVYLDAFVPDNGKALFDYLPDDGKSDRELAAMAGRSRRARRRSSRSMRQMPTGWIGSARCTRCPVLKRRHGSAAPATTSQPSDTFWHVALTALSSSFTPRQGSAAGGKQSLHAGMM